MPVRDPWERDYPLASLGLEPAGRRPGAVPAFALAGVLFAALGCSWSCTPWSSAMPATTPAST